MMPTTPVRPRPVTTSSTAEFLQLLGRRRPAVLKTSKFSSGVCVQMASPAGDFVLHFGGSVQDRHVWLSCC